MNLILKVFIICFFALPAAMAAPSGFSDHFEIKRDMFKKITSIVLKKKQDQKLPTMFVVTDLIEDLEAIKKHPDVLLEFFKIIKDLDFPSWPADVQAETKKGLIRLQTTDLESLKKMLDNAGIDAALKYLDFELGKHLKTFRVLASPNQSDYFYKNQILVQIGKMAVDMAQRGADTQIGINMGYFVVHQAIDLFLERRMFYQNMLLYYLNNKDAEQMGLTESEVELVRSSIYEAKINWYDMKESKAAKKNWPDYGKIKLAEDLVESNENLNKHGGDYDVLGNRLSIGFLLAKKSTDTQIVHLLYRSKKLTKSLHTAYSFENPERVRAMRSFFRLIQLSFRAVPTPIIANVVDFFLESFYVHQRQLEGALLGHFLSNKFEDESKVLINQTINPFIKYDLL